jgi:hypothetical protein
MDVTYPGKGRGIKDRDDRWRVIEILMTDVLAEIKPTDPFKLGKQSVPGNTTDLIPPTVQYPNRLEVHMMYEFIQNSRCILWTQIGMFRPIRMDHTNCLQVAIKTLQFNCSSPVLQIRRSDRSCVTICLESQES